MKKVRTGIIGYGKVARTHAEALTTLPESEFAGICGRSLTRAESLARQYTVSAFDDIQDMIEQAGVQAVIVCTPHPVHASHATLAAEAGAHVLVE